MHCIFVSESGTKRFNNQKSLENENQNPWKKENPSILKKIENHTDGYRG